MTTDGERDLRGERPDVEAVRLALEPRLDDLIALRRQLHAHPEVSHAELATTETIGERLRIAGLDPVVLARGTGLVCDIGDTSGAAPIVALRADIDALAMPDLKDVPYRSQNPGVAHACGHDAHTTVVLGAGLLLRQLLERSGLGGGVRLVFEPAEESVPAGALDVITAGALDGVTSIYGLHCDPKLDVGRVGVRSGPLTAAADMVEVTLTGPGGHTARPELTVDLVSVAARLALELPPLVADLARDHGDLRLVLGALRAGDAANVIPTSAVLRGSLRTPDRDAWEQAVPVVRDAVLEILGGSGAEWTVEHRRGVPPVVNDAEATVLLAESARTVLGAEAVVEAPRSWGGDSFAWYLDEVPGSYARLGVRDPAGAAAPVDLHAGNFDIDERAIGIGIRVLVEVALRSLESATRR